MNKKNLILIFTFAVIISILSINVYASENQIYVNNNGVELTSKEYEFINTFYGNNYFENMTQEDYDWIAVLDINNNEVYYDVLYDNNKLSFENLSMFANASINGTIHQTNSKRLAIAKTCDAVKCNILTNLTWLTNPTIRSYDVIGARFSGTSLYNNSITTKVKSSSGVTYYSNNRFLSNGFGTSVKLPTSSTNIIIEQSFYTNLGGSIYSSYQHATSNISLANSFLYTITSSGYGKVFNFYGNALNVYDGMGGVDI